MTPFILIFWSVAQFGIKIPVSVDFDNARACQIALETVQSKGFQGVCVTAN